MASQVFFGPMPMKEKILGPPSSCEMATALFETGAGRGLSWGSSAARRRASRKKQNNAGSSLFDADFIAEMIAAKRRKLGTLTSEPRVLAVFAIGVAEFCFK